jgi:hypothetical protein
MAQLWTTGPAFLYVGINGLTNRGPVFVGTDEDGPTIEIGPRYQEVKNDIGGDEAMDDSYQGRSATIDYNLNRWEEVAIAALEQTNPFSNSLRGTDDPGDVGSLMITEGKAFSLWVVFPYAVTSPIAAIAKAAMLGMPAGYHFYATILTTDNHTRLGTKPRRLRFGFKARRLYKQWNQYSQGGLVGTAASTFTQNLFSFPGGLNAAAAPGSFVLYDHSMTGIPLPN